MTCGLNCSQPRLNPANNPLRDYLELISESSHLHQGSCHLSGAEGCSWGFHPCVSWPAPRAAAYSSSQIKPQNETQLLNVQKLILQNFRGWSGWAKFNNVGRPLTTLFSTCRKIISINFPMIPAFLDFLGTRDTFFWSSWFQTPIVLCLISCFKYLPHKMVTAFLTTLSNMDNIGVKL